MRFLKQFRKRTMRGPELVPASVQPEKGEIILHCGHVRGPNDDCHWLLLGPTAVKRPNGSTVQARFVAQCDPCFRRDEEDGVLPHIRGEGVYPGGVLRVRK